MPSASTGHTGLATGEWPVWYAGTGLDPWTTWYLAADDTYLGYEASLGRVMTFPDVTGDGLPDIGFPRAFVGLDIRSGMPQKGIEDLRNGVDANILSYIAGYAGDTDDDGNGDLWLVHPLPVPSSEIKICLYGGPVHTGDDATLCVQGMYSQQNLVGNVDADDDGILDLVVLDTSNSIHVFYGPFTEDRPLDHPSRNEDTFVNGGNSCGGQLGYWLGPGTDLDQKLVVAQGGLCDPYVFDVRGPRGRQATWLDGVAWAGDETQLPALNLHGDGLNAVVYAGAIYPPVGGMSYGDLAFLPGQSLYAGIGDLTGDGRGELLVGLGRFLDDGDLVWDILIVPGRPDMHHVHAGDVGVLLGDTGTLRVSTLRDPAFHDLDGDGLVELFLYGSEHVWMWRGQDIRQALLDLDRLPDELTHP